MTENKSQLPRWTLIAPVIAWLLFAGHYGVSSLFYSILLFLALIASVLAAVHHAEVVAHRVGEPLGTLILAIAVTIIEVGLIITCIVGLCLLIGGLKYGE